MAAALCPACGQALKKQPQRKTKCPSCGGYIYVKSSPVNREKRLVTEAEAKEIEIQWAAYQERQERLQMLQPYGVTEQEYDKVKVVLSHNFDNQSLDWQTAYFFCNELLSKETQLHHRKMLCLGLVRLLDEKSLDFGPVLRKAFETELQDYKTKEEIIKGVEIVNCGIPGPCEACQKNSGKAYPLDVAIQSMPLPCKGCTCKGIGGLVGYCQCYYRTILVGEDQ